MDWLATLAIPGGALTLGAVVFVLAKISSWRFDNKHPRLSRQGRRALAEEQAKRTGHGTPMKLVPMPLPSALHPADYEIEEVTAALNRLDRKREIAKARGESNAA